MQDIASAVVARASIPSEQIPSEQERGVFLQSRGRHRDLRREAANGKSGLSRENSLNAASYPVAHSQILGARREGQVPHLVALLVEDQLRVGRRRDPGAALELAFELARAPAGIAEGHEAFLRTAAV